VLHGGVFGVSPDRIAASLAPLPPLDREALCQFLEVGFREALRDAAAPGEGDRR